MTHCKFGLELRTGTGFGLGRDEVVMAPGPNSRCDKRLRSWKKNKNYAQKKKDFTIYSKFESKGTYISE
jgi:hypothetical protein